VTLLLARRDVERLLDPLASIDAVEAAFRARGEGRRLPAGVLGLGAAEGTFHVKAAMSDHGRPYYAAKINANFPSNPSRHSLPTIQGVLALFDAMNGVPLAVMDSMAITVIRTAAASAVAARYLAPARSRVATIVGCGAQSKAQLAAVHAVRPLERVFAYDLDRASAERLARDATATIGVRVEVADDLPRATRQSDIVITCTTSHRAFLEGEDVAVGAFIAAVGADNEDKQEIDPGLMAAAAVVTDSTDQCASIGDLHHAIAAGLMRRDKVRAELGDVVVDPSRGRRKDDEIVIFDSTGVAFQDVAVAAIVYEGAVRDAIGLEVQLDDGMTGGRADR
jgi:ornithine cyclodeaminase/alanine dehydrogenase-like protein (mu-crystallin family)